jgi:hypothetical protein
MGGGLMQLVAYGAQDVYLTGNPQITLFKVVYRRHTNFSTECIELTLDTAKPGNRSTVQVLRNADLATKCHLRCVIPDLVPTNAAFNGKVAWVRRLGHAMMSTIEVQIGGSMIDKHYSAWLDIWYELTHRVDQERGYNAMIGDVPALTTLNADGISGLNYTVFVPLQFWFCRNYGLALPLIALQYHEVRFNIEWESIDNLVVYTAGTGSASSPVFSGLAYGSSGILVDYVYLDSEERRRFAQVGHEYLIEQMQYDERSLQSGSSNQTFTLNFNHPCKEFVWAHKLGAFSGASDSAFLGYTASTEQDAWAAELQAAADRLALSMMPLTTTLDDPVTDSATEYIFTVGATDTILSYTIGNTVFKFTVVGAPAANVNLRVVMNPLVSGSVNLADRLQTVSVDVSISHTEIGTSDTFEVTVNDIHVNDHTLSIYDLSTPLASFTDNRVAGADTTGADVTVVQPNNYGALLDGTGNIVLSGNLNFNGQDRFDVREGNYFNYVQPGDHHTRTPADGINVYSFGLHPEQHQPTGTANMSRIDTARVVYKVADPCSSSRPVAFDIYSNTVVFLLVTNYNVLRIMSGMGGLAYSN